MRKQRYIFTVLLVACICMLPLTACTAGQGEAQPEQPAALPAGQPAQPVQGNAGGNLQGPTGSPAYTTGAGTGFIEVHITDAPPKKKEITSVMVTVSSIEIHTAGSGQANQPNNPAGDDNATVSENATKSKGQDRGPQNQQQGSDTWVKINFTGSSTFDLLKIKGLDDIFAAGEVPAGKYTQVRLVINSASVGFSDNTTETATVPGNELKFVQPFDISEGKTTVLTFDFDADKSVSITGQDKVMIKPVVKLDVKLK